MAYSDFALKEVTHRFQLHEGGISKQLLHRYSPPRHGRLCVRSLK